VVTKHKPDQDDSVVLAALGEAIRQHRAQAGLTQAELAELSNVGRPHLGLIEVGKKNPSVLMLARIARGLGVAPSELLKPETLSEAAAP